MADARPEPVHAPACPVLDPNRPRVELFGVPVDALDMATTLRTVRGFVDCGAPHQHVCLNAAKVVELAGNSELVRAVARCELISVDGQAVVWASKLLHQQVPERVAGIDLFERLLEQVALDGTPVYLLGAREVVVQQVAEVARQRWPGLVLAGAGSGYWTPDEEQRVVADVASSGAKMLFLALPSPRKELFLERYAEDLGVPFRMGVGGSFDVIAGFTMRAPLWAQLAGLEWVFRLLQEPRRMARRYLVGNTKFLCLTLRHKMGRR